MTTAELLSDFDFPPGDRHADLLLIRLFCLYLADHVYGLSDAISFREWLLGIAETARLTRASAPELSLRQELVPPRSPAPPRRYNARGCPDCDHEHEGREECGKYLGEGKFCHCPTKVHA